MISKDWTILSIVFPLYSWSRSQDAVIEKNHFSDEGYIYRARAITQAQTRDVMRGLGPDKNDSQQSIRSITLYVTVVSRPQKITQTDRDSMWHQAEIYQTYNLFLERWIDFYSLNSKYTALRNLVGLFGFRTETLSEEKQQLAIFTVVVRADHSSSECVTINNNNKFSENILFYWEGLAELGGGFLWQAKQE